MFRRPFFRRPFLRAAIIGGAGYALGRRAARGSARPDTATQPRPDPEATVERLKELAALHDAGKLTDAEFAAAKRDVLGR